MFPDDINWFKRKPKNDKIKMHLFCHQMVSRGIHIGYNILHMPLVRFYLDYFNGFGKLRGIYFAYRYQKAKIMPCFDKTGVAQIAPNRGAQITPNFFQRP